MELYPRAPVDVLIVEDDTAIQQVVNDVLTEVDIRAEVCPFGWQAHLYIRQTQPKVVILDVQLPLVSGIDLFYLLRGDPRTSTIPVIFLTANPQKVRWEIPNYQDMGAVILAKPFNIDALVATVATALTA